MTKFSKRFKLAVVKEYLSTSLGSRTIARQYGIGSETTVLKWTQQYQRFGVERLEVRRPVRVYDGGFKLSVLKWLKTEHAALTQAALHFNLSEPSTIYQWQRIFETEGVEALFRSRGLDPIMTGDKQTKREKSLSELEKLKEENELLRIENEYLKKLKALVHDHQKPKPKSSRN